MMTAGIVSSVLFALLAPAQSTLPTQTGPMRNTFVVAAETVIDSASALDIKSDDVHFNAQFQLVKTAKENLKSMADDERERDAASATDDLIFAVAACHLQAKDGAPTDRCQTQIENARTRAMDAIRKHKSNGAWVDGPPAASPIGEASVTAISY